MPMPDLPFKTALDITIAGIKTFGDIGLLPPGVAVALGIVNAIKENCEQVKSHQKQCERLAIRCAELFQLLAKQTKDLEGSPVGDSVEAVKSILNDVCLKTNTYASYGFWRAFRHSAAIESGLNECLAKVNKTIEGFHIEVQLLLAATVHNLVSKIDEMAGATVATSEKMTMLTAAIEDPKVLKGMPREQLEATEEQLYAVYSEIRKKCTENTRSSTVIIGGQVIDRVQANQCIIAYQKGLVRIHKEIGLPPNVKNLDGQIKKEPDYPYDGGLVSDIYKGFWLNGTLVAIKTLRTVEMTKEREVKRFENEVRVWRNLQHPNILTFLGVTYDFGKVSLVSEWQENTDLFKYCKLTQNADKLKLLIDAAKGLQYLHSKNTVHGNLKCSKILVTGPEGPDQVPRAVISDFGMSKVIDDTSDPHLQSVSVQASGRWLAPEFTTSAKTHISADIFSFSATMWECFYVERPYTERRREAEVIAFVLGGGRPERKGNNPWVNNSTWLLMENCWQADPTARPKITEVLERLVGIQEKRKALMDA